MQEIAERVFIETSYPGVTLGAINWSHGLILIDAPIRPEDARSWRSALLNLGGGVDRLLINLDGHYDRTIGTRNMDCTVVGHVRLLDIYRSRPTTFKAQGNETGADWEQQSNLGSIRWYPPEITFSDRLIIHWNGNPIILQHRPGPSNAATWVELVKEKVLFLGDYVTPGQPPHLASADLPLWIENLKHLIGKEYRNYLLVSGRGGLVAADDVRKQLRFLERVHQQLESLAAKEAPTEETQTLVNTLAASFTLPLEMKEVYRQRLRYGLHQCYLHTYSPEGRTSSVE